MSTLNLSRGECDSAATVVLGLEGGSVAILKAECKVSSSRLHIGVAAGVIGGCRSWT